jgi:tetratricopeptide (TPR) repeat protein
MDFMVTSERMQSLQRMLQKEPDDLFLLYAIGLEHKKAGEFADALEYLDRVLKKDPLYCVAYQQMGQVHEMAGDVEAAKRAYRDGIASALRKGDLHAKEEMEGALAMLE